MLREITNSKQAEGEPRRRWFTGEQMDLYVWYEGDEVVQFQICYDKGPGEQALTWRHDVGLSHHAVDDGEGGVFRMKSSPILKQSSRFDRDRVCALFTDAGRKLEHDLFSFIASRLEEYRQ